MDLTDTVYQTVCNTMTWSPNDVDGNTLLRDCPGWDSVNQLRVLMALELTTGTRIPIKRFLVAYTIDDIAAVLKSLSGHGPLA